MGLGGGMSGGDIPFSSGAYISLKIYSKKQ